MPAPVRPAAPLRLVGLVSACVGGLLLGPALGTLLLVGFAPGAVAAALLLLAMTAAGIHGIVLAASRWRAAAHEAGGPRADADPAGLRFALPAQRASFTLAIVLLAVGALTAIGYALATAQPPTGPVDSVDDVLVPAGGALVLSACVVPVLIAQDRWTRRPGPADAEAAVLHGRVPGARRLIRTARITAMTAWTIAAATGALTTALVVQSAVRQIIGLFTAYSSSEVTEETWTELSGQGYLVAGVKCPAGVPDQLRRQVLRCTLTTLGRPASVRVIWTPDSSGVATSRLVEGSARGLVRAQDLTTPEPPLSAPGRDVTGPVMAAAVRAALAADGFDVASPDLAPISCPGASADYDGVVRCDLGDARHRRTIDVYPDGDAIRPRVAELADLPR